MSYKSDRSWSDLHIPEIKRICGEYLLQETPFLVDATEAADLMVLTGRNMKIAARVRRPGYSDRFKNEFTIRSKRESGAKTEMQKIASGFGDWMFYGHALHDEEPGFSHWMLIDLDVFRMSLIKEGFDQGWKRLCFLKSNYDNQTHFFAFDVTRFPREMLIASSHEISFDGQMRAA